MSPGAISPSERTNLIRLLNLRGGEPFRIKQFPTIISVDSRAPEATSSGGDDPPRTLKMY